MNIVIDEALAKDKSEPIAIRSHGECVACGQTEKCWEIDSSGWEYSGIMLCRTCLRKLAETLGE